MDAWNGERSLEAKAREGWSLMRFLPCQLTTGERALRDEVRGFLADELPPGFRPGLGMGARHDPMFSQKLAARGWVGMAIPEQYGGHGRSAVERFVVAEELLAAGAPVMAHFVADRQTAPALLQFGTEEQRLRFLPAISAGQCWFSLGMSEPDSGSDLASVRTTATEVEGGWLVNGTKIWTTYAHLNHYFVILCRTSPPVDADRHRGLTQLIVDLRSPGVHVSAIPFIDGSHHFNEVVMENAFVPADMLLGTAGAGWHQVTSELAFERSGPERYLSSYNVYKEFVREVALEGLSPSHAHLIGHLAARLSTLRQLSLSVARQIDGGRSPATEAAVVKDMGTTFEQESIALIRDFAEQELDPEGGTLFSQLLAEAVLTGPSFTLRGGTTEILRSIAAKGLSR